MKIFIIVIISAIVFGTMGYFVAKRVSNPEQVIPSEEMLKNSNEELTTTPTVDANSVFLKEEMARKKQRDIDREKCIADVERERIKCKEDGSLLERRACRGADDTNSIEQIDRCYFRFPTN